MRNSNVASKHANDQGYTINPLTGKYIKKSGDLWKKLSTVFFTDKENNFLNQRIPSGDYFNNQWGTSDRDGKYLSPASQNRLDAIHRQQTKKTPKKRRTALNPTTGRRVYVGSPAWKSLYQEYKWDGQSFTTAREESKAMKIDKQLEKGDIINTALGYKVVYYHTARGGMKTEKRGFNLDTRDFKIRKNDDDGSLTVSNRNGSNAQKIELMHCKKHQDGTVDKSVFRDFCSILVEYMKSGQTDAPQYIVYLSTLDLFSSIDGEREIMMLKDARAPNKRVLIKGHEKEWGMTFLLGEYQRLIEEMEAKGSGWIYEGNMGFSLVMCPLKVCVGAAIHTPLILGKTVVNACIDDNRCLQRSLINACNESITKQRNTSNTSAYAKYWNKPNKNLVFNHTIYEIEEAVHIQDNRPFVAHPDNFKVLERLLDIYITCYQFNMQAGFDLKSNTDENAELFTVEPVYPVSRDDDELRDDKPHIYLCILNDIEKEVKHCVLIKDREQFAKYVSFVATIRNYNNNKGRKRCCRWCLYVNCKSNVLKHEIKCHPDCVPEEERYILSQSPEDRLKWTHQRYQMFAPVAVYADFEASIDDEKRHNPIMISLAVVSRVPNIETQYRVFRGPHEDPNDFVPVISYLENLRQRVVDELYDEEKMIVTDAVNKDYEEAEVCPFCHIPMYNKEDFDTRTDICKIEKNRHLVDLESFYTEDPDLLSSDDTYEFNRAEQNGDITKAHTYLEQHGILDGHHNLSSEEWKQIRESYHINKSRMKQLRKKTYSHTLTNEERDEYEKLQNTALRYGRLKVRHHAHIAGEYSNGTETRQYAAGEYICTCCSKCNLQFSFNKKNYKLPVYFHNGSRYDNSFIMKIIHRYRQSHPKSKLSVIPTALDKEMLITLDNIDFKDSLRMISGKLKDIVSQTLGSDLNNYPVTRKLLKQYLEDHNKHYDESYIELLTRKEPMFYSLITSYSVLSNKQMPTRRQCYDELSHSFMSLEDYNHMKTLWTTFNIKNWGQYYELYNLLDVTLLADAFEHFRTATYNSFGVDSAHYLTSPQMSYSLFLKTVSNNDTSRYEVQSEKWASYQMKIGADEGHTETQLQDIYVKRMNEFYESGGIRLLSKKDMEVFIALKNNLRGGITQISTRYAKTPVDASDSTNVDADPNSKIFYLDANNLYGGTMHRMMPYDIVYGTKQEWEAIRKHGATAWINSLGTYDQYGYFIDCDVTCPDKLHDKFNDLPFFPIQRVGMYSPFMKQLAKEAGIEEMINENDKTKKLICDLYPKTHYVVHYSMLQLALQQGYKLTKIHRIFKFKQAPFIFEYVNHLSEMRAKATSSVLKNLFKLLANSIYGKFVETGLDRMTVKFASTLKERNNIMMKYSELIDGMDLYDDLWVGKIFNPVKRMSKPFFIGFAILDMSKYIIYDFYYNKMRKTFKKVTLLGQDTDSLIVKVMDSMIDEKMLDMYKSFDFSELDTDSYFYNRLVEYYNSDKVNKTDFPSLKSFVNYNKKVAGPIFKDEHKGHRITEFCGLRPKLYCILDEKNVIHNAAKGVPRTVTDNVGNIIKVKNMEAYKRVLFGKTKDDAVLTGTFNRIANRELEIETMEQTKVLFTCLDNKRYVCDDGIHTLAFREGME